MTMGEAILIFKSLDSGEHSTPDIALAIYQVMNMTTHNSISKDDMIRAIKWLWFENYELSELGQRMYERTMGHG